MIKAWTANMVTQEFMWLTRVPSPLHASSQSLRLHPFRCCPQSDTRSLQYAGFLLNSSGMDHKILNILCLAFLDDWWKLDNLWSSSKNKGNLHLVLNWSWWILNSQKWSLIVYIEEGKCSKGRLSVSLNFLSLYQHSDFPPNNKNAG